MTPARFLMALLCLAGTVSASATNLVTVTERNPQSATTGSGSRWWKGNRHTLWSDGDDYPEHRSVPPRTAIAWVASSWGGTSWFRVRSGCSVLA